MQEGESAKLIKDEVRNLKLLKTRVILYAIFSIDEVLFL